MTAATAKKILLVDDDESLRQSLGEHLRLHEEFVTVEVDTGSRALEAAKNEYFDAILLDAGLPDMDGRLARLEISASLKAVDTVRMGDANYGTGPTEAARK